MIATEEPTTQTPAPDRPKRTVHFRVSRWKRGDARPHFDRFDVQVDAPRATVLDALTLIRRTQDPTLILRHSCYHASCGTCGMRVNDREVLACVTHLEDLDDEVKVEPIATQALVADLVTDMVDFYARFEVARRALIRSSDAPQGGTEPPGVAAYNRFENCIECGLCTSACPILGSDPRYLGPAALAAAWRTVEEPRGVNAGPVLQLTDDPQGSWRCHEVWECSEACPSNVDPAAKIMLLRQAQARSRVGRIFGRGGASRG